MSGKRRSVLAVVVLAAAAATTAAVLPAAPGSHAAPAHRPAVVTTSTTTPIKHVVIVDLENHTFDNLFGFWCQQNRRRCLDAEGNFVGMPPEVYLANGAVVTPSDTRDLVPLVAHNVAAQRAAMNVVGGVPQMNGWNRIHALRSGPSCTAAVNYQCISGFEPSQIPNVIALAQRFAISDMMFSLSDSPSWEGHFEFATATSDGFTGFNPTPKNGYASSQGWGCDSGKFTPWQASASSTPKSVPSCIPDYNLRPSLPDGGAVAPTPVSQVPTIMDELDQAGLTWKIYSATKGTKGYGIWDICPSIAGCLDTSQHLNLVPDGSFTKDAAAGTLPNLSIVTPGGTHFMDAGHNGMSITSMDNWLGQLASAAETSPEWYSTAMFVTWDDCGCFYDQVPPPLAPDGTQEGPRAPLLIISPWVNPGYTDNTPTNFAGILAFTERTFGLAPLTVNDANSYGFGNAFFFGAGRRPVRPARMVMQPLPAWTKRLDRHPPAVLFGPQSS